MTAFAILSGKSLKAAIAGYGKIAATFTEKTHQLAYSAINHVEEHHDAIYCNALYNATPANYRAALVTWMKDFGKLTFDATTKAFTYNKAKKSDLPTALTVSPAEYAKAASTKATNFDEVKQLESLIKKFEEKKATPAVLNALRGVLRIAQGKGAPAAENVVAAPTLVKARKAKAAKAKPVAVAPVAAPVEGEQVAA